MRTLTKVLLGLGAAAAAVVSLAGGSTAVSFAVFPS